MPRPSLSLLLVLPCLSLAPALWSTENAGEIELTREGKASIHMALQYLANKQRADGSLEGGSGTSAGIVGVACMAWMAAGNLPGEGPFGKNVARGIEYILNCQNTEGLFRTKQMEGGYMYHHGLATICLAEAWGQTHDKRIYDKLKKAVERIIHSQNHEGGWRYEPKVSDADLSVVVMQLLALRAARDAGIAVPKEVIDNALHYVERCREPRDANGYSGFGYTGPQKSWSCSAEGVMSLMLCGNYKAADFKDCLDYLVHVHEKKEDRQWFSYGHYYAAQAMYQAGSQGSQFLHYWQQWYPDISKTIILSQIINGTERGYYRQNDGYALWGVSALALVLEIPYRYLPVYQR